MSPGRTRAAVGLGPLLLGLLLARAAPAADEDPWRWLHAPDVWTSPVAAAPDLTGPERVLAERVLRSTVALAIGPPDADGPDLAVVGTGVVLEGGLVAAPWRVIATIGPRRGLWIQADPVGPWVRAAPVGDPARGLLAATWWADVGLVRPLAPVGLGPPVRWVDPDRGALGRRHLGVGSARTRGWVVRAAPLEALELFDPAAPGGRLRVDGPRSPEPSPGATPIALRYGPGMSTGFGGGTAVFDGDGACVGLVGETGPDEAEVLVRPAPWLRPVLAMLRDRGAFDPPDLGFDLAPRPVGHGRPSLPLPPELVHARGSARGGALVRRVLSPGPASRVLWEGDVVLAIEGRPVFGEVYESVGLALLAVHLGAPTDVTVLRGTTPRVLQVQPARASELREDVRRWHEIEAGRLDRLP